MDTRTARRERNDALHIRDVANLKLKIINSELHNYIDDLEGMIQSLIKENISLNKKISDLDVQLKRELETNESLVKHSHILFEQLSKIKNKDCVLRKRVEAFKPTADDLESFFKDR